jgi:hypothetical protein
MAARATSRLLLGLACLTGALLGGCGGPRVAKVSGRVTYAGRPVSGGKVLFYPEAGRMALGEIGPDGRYTLTTFQPGDGALIGGHRVAIEATRVGPGSYQAPKNLAEEKERSRGAGPGGKVLVAGKVDWLVPEKYARPELSGLTATVRGGRNDIDFDLPGEP